MNTLAVAMMYVAWRWSVIPIQPGGKTPLVKWKDFTNRLPTNEELHKWFANSVNNIAVVTGRISGLYVLDCDSDRAWQWALAHCPATRMSKSPKGFHLWFRLARNVVQPNRVNVLSLQLDCRGEDGYVLVEPSRLADGRQYRWLNQAPLALWNPQLIPAPAPVATSSVDVEGVDYDRRRQRARLYVARIDSISGQSGEKQLFRAATALVSKFNLEPQDALDELRIWNAYKAKPIWNDNKLQHTIRQALKYRRWV